MRAPRIGRRKAAGTTAPAPWALLSLLLRYPDEDPLAWRGELEALGDGPAVAPLERFFADLDASEDDPQVRYVATFDLQRRITPYLTFYEHGDTRRRGVALLTLKRLYRDAGLPLDDDGGELPDHLAVMLAFAAVAPEGYGEQLLERHRAALELLRLALHDTGSPYRHVLDAIDACLPPLGIAERADVARLAQAGPPQEEVGLEPFAPPEVMPIGGRP